MLTRWAETLALVVLAPLLIAGLGACSANNDVETPRLREKIFSMRPATAVVRVGILAGRLSDFKVVERVNETTGEVVHAPQFQATLQLKNTSSDQVVRLVTGSIEYLDAAGIPIPLAPGRSDTSFKFYPLRDDRLDPEETVTQRVDVPFPGAVVSATPLAQIRLRLTYLPAPYHEESTTLPLALAGR